MKLPIETKLKLLFPGFIREHRFMAARKFRWDYCWLEPMIALEVQGATWVKGGHSTGTGIRRDAEKFTLGQIYGWLVVIATMDMIRDGIALDLLAKAFAVREK